MKSIKILFAFCCLLSTFPAFSQGLQELSTLITNAKNLETKAEGAAGINAVIRAYREILALDSLNYTALCKIGNYNSLLGTAYTKKKKEKAKLYLEAKQLLEKAMRTNVAFDNAIKEGAAIAKASSLLSAKEIDAMGYWFTVNFYYFKECLGIIGKAKNMELIEQNNVMIEAVKNLDSTWCGGGVYFSKGIYYIAMPEKYGGSKEEAQNQFEKAIAIAPDFICNRWGRAKYLYSLTGEKLQYMTDLEWVVNQDLNQEKNYYVPHAWNYHFQEEAKEMLEKEK